MKVKNDGITLIALIITIIVMLILVAVSITTVIRGELFQKAGEGVRDTDNQEGYNDKACNIYDLEGNVYELTAEACSALSRVVRGR